ncbi:hypothetical protein UDZ25_06020 [Serratia marcescens]|uniref:hypothetical protein n=1 Tax=Serratia marcescens TaxID=615 RepID=UPI000744E437|nr:hypothetical protein [Serratia marcescens]CUZ54591.1 Uncharacterised protein [Serratia marcescens]
MINFIHNPIKVILKGKWIYIIALSLIIFLPVIIYILKFFSLPFSDKTQDWTNFASYLGGMYSAAFGLASTIILCLTLYFTIRHNQAQLEQLKKDSFLNLFTSYIQALNDKLDKRKNKIYSISSNDSAIISVSEDIYINELRKRYNIIYSVELQNNPASTPSPFKLAPETLTDLKVKYPQEITSFINILSMIGNTKDNELKEELISLFHSLTYRDRTFWLIMYAYQALDGAKLIIMQNAKLIALADGLSGQQTGPFLPPQDSNHQ